MILIFIFTFFCGATKRFHLFEAPKRSVKIKKIMPFFLLIPEFQIRTTRVKTVFMMNSQLMPFLFL